MLKIIKKFKFILSALIIFLFILFLLSRGVFYKQKDISYGVTFSKKESLDLNLNWQENYLAILDDLKVRKIRIPAYWDEIEKKKDVFVWDDLDWQINEAEKRKAEIILAIGTRLPRWPECHFPDWAKKLDKEKREKEVLKYIKKTIERYKNNKTIKVWQIENEPFLSHFGQCPKLDKNFLDKEIILAHELDQRPVLISDSGELSLWLPATKRADIFGTTMYRDTYSHTFKKYIHYPIEPGFFRFKKNIVNFFTHPEKWLVIELQGEPWGPRPFQELSQEERDKTMSYEKFLSIINFSRQTGFREFYFWGAEWWYWEKTFKYNDKFWNKAKTLFNPNL